MIVSDVFVECTLCPAKKSLASHDMSDAEAVRVAESLGWTIKPTVCPKCNTLPRREYKKKMREFKAYWKKHKVCDRCGGDGLVWVTPRSRGSCQECAGEGRVAK